MKTEILTAIQHLMRAQKFIDAKDKQKYLSLELTIHVLLDLLKEMEEQQ